MFKDFNDMFNDNDDKFKNLLKILSEGISNQLNGGNKNLGTPTSVEKFDEDGFSFEKKTWKTSFGTITMIEMVNDSSNIKPNKVNLEDELNRAIKEERYEDAAKIRDKIKNNESLITENDTLEDNNEWNF